MELLYLYYLENDIFVESDETVLMMLCAVCWGMYVCVFMWVYR